MADNEILVCENTELLNIFETEEDKRGTDLLAMSNYFDVFVSKLDTSLDQNGKWETVIDASSLLGQIAVAIKSGFDISKINMLVADTSHFSKEIVEGLKEGIYHIGQSKEVAGNLRPAVLDENERLVKFVTLKKAINPSEILADMANLSMQLSLKHISAQIEDVGRDVQGISEFVRREALSNKFIYARDKIMSAASVSLDEQEQLLLMADDYLMQGLSDLYVDVDAEVRRLFDLSGPFRSLREADKILTHINEDMQMIPRYVGMRVYLADFRGNTAEANRVVGDFRYHLEKLSERKLENSKYTALEIIHRYYPYSESNIDFWLEQPQQMLSGLRLYEKMIDQKSEELFYIDMEE
ncbi:hypothetical protein SAMN02910292_02858 [Lachnospiraceae bacterium XBB2008]|nr:hypothetical protein SAMN02910292_02858 [Lachnospiraceae bacterium XBB2008]